VGKGKIVRVHFVAFGLVAEVALEQSKEVVHFDPEFLGVTSQHAWYDRTVKRK